MSKFNVKIVEDDGNTHIYTEASKINIVEDIISVDYEDERAIHQLDKADEIIIKTNR